MERGLGGGGDMGVMKGERVGGVVWWGLVFERVWGGGKNLLCFDKNNWFFDCGGVYFINI